MIKIDLHGMTENQAIAKIQTAIYSFENDAYEDEMEIVTGIGTGRLKAILEDELYDLGYKWYHRGSNQGSYIVTKR